MNLKNSANYFLVAALFAMLILGCGCAMPPPNLLAGWAPKRFECDRQGNITNHFQQLIFDNCNGFMKQNNLSFWYGVINDFYEDGKGKYALEFEAAKVGEVKVWRYFLFYDKDGKIIEVRRYYLGRSSC
jgi:hypothetical protein